MDGRKLGRENSPGTREMEQYGGRAAPTGLRERERDKHLNVSSLETQKPDRSCSEKKVSAGTILS